MLPATVAVLRRFGVATLLAASATAAQPFFTVSLSATALSVAPAPM